LREGIDHVFKKHKTNNKGPKGLKEGVVCSNNKKRIAKDMRGLKEGI
jgi:hypothetical protein